MAPQPFFFFFFYPLFLLPFLFFSGRDQMDRPQKYLLSFPHLRCQLLRPPASSSSSSSSSSSFHKAVTAIILRERRGALRGLTLHSPLVHAAIKMMCAETQASCVDRWGGGSSIHPGRRVMDGRTALSVSPLGTPRATGRRLPVRSGQSARF